MRARFMVQFFGGAALAIAMVFVITLLSGVWGKPAIVMVRQPVTYDDNSRCFM